MALANIATTVFTPPPLAHLRVPLPPPWLRPRRTRRCVTWCHFQGARAAVPFLRAVSSAVPRPPAPDRRQAPARPCSPPPPCRPSRPLPPLPHLPRRRPPPLLPRACLQMVQCFGRKRHAVAVAVCKSGKGLVRLSGQPLHLATPEVSSAAARGPRRAPLARAAPRAMPWPRAAPRRADPHTPLTPPRARPRTRRSCASS